MKFLGVMSNLGSGPGVSNKLFVGVPLSAIPAKLEVEAGDKCAERTTTLGKDTCRRDRMHSTYATAT